MNTLLELIRSMSKEEYRYFKVLANKTNKSSKRKDIILFNYYKTHKNTKNEAKIAKKLYNNNLNAFYRLKNRLINELKTSLTIQYINKETSSAAYIKEIFVAKISTALNFFYQIFISC